MIYRPTFRDIALAALIAMPMVIPAAPSPRAQPPATASPSAHVPILQVAQADTHATSALD
jgi:hypothetical protein